MSLRRSARLTAVAVVAGLLGGGGALAAGALLSPSTSVSSPSELPVTFQNASSDDAPGDISGPCDEAEHANDPRCAGTAVPSPATNATAGTTPTTNANTPSAVTPSGTRSLDAAGAGTVTYTVNGSTLSLVSATPSAGWSVEVERGTGIEIEVDFRSGTRRVQVNIEFEDGSIRERVRTRDDATDDETRIENGTVVRTESGDDNSGPGSVEDDADDAAEIDDDNSGPGSVEDNSGPGSVDLDDADDIDDDNSGHGSDD